MKGQRSFRHETIAYERPSAPYRCGRASLWRKACWQGPDGSGACRGQSECAPALIGDRWHCRRPKLAGGKCDEGPRPDGTCAHCHPPCMPSRSVRASRGHVAALAALAFLLFMLVGANPFADSVVNPLALDPGELNSVHAGFTREKGCASCHASHEKEAFGWIAAAFRDNDPSARCLDCHDFAGPPRRAHNFAHAGGRGAKDASCASCHTEHKGAKFAIARVSDVTCANCHEKRFDNFAKGHAPFPDGYPFTRPATVYFDHAKHLRIYFGDPKVLRRSKAVAQFASAAKEQCTACHAVEGATREVRPKPYGEICASCHESDILKAEFPLLERDQLTAAASVLLGMEKDGDEAQAARRLGQLWPALARGGADALTELAVNAGAGKKDAAALFAGLPGPVAQGAGAAFAARREASAKPGEEPGWTAGETGEGRQALFLRPAHGDPALKAWIEWLKATSADKDEDRRNLAIAALDPFLGAEGPGACGKCHGAALKLAAPNASSGAWQRSSKAASPYQRFSHAPHLGLVDPGSGCKACHELNPEVRYAKYFSSPKAGSYQSGFHGIRKEACVECHREGQVDAACQVCHAYHLPHRFNLGFRTRGAQK